MIDVPGVPEELLDLALQVRDHYLSTLGAALGLALPPAGSLRLRRVASRRAQPAWPRSPPVSAAARALGQLHRRREQRSPGDRRAGGAPAPQAAGLSASYRLHVDRERPAARLLEAGKGQPARLGARQRAALDYVGRRKVDEATLRGTPG